MKRISVEIDEKTLSELNSIVRKGMRTVRVVTHARILLLSHSGRRSDEIAEILGVDPDTVLRVKKRFLEGGVEKALHDDSKPGHPKKYGNKETAEIIALACSSPPEGRKRWTVRLIVEEMKKKEGFEGINRESVRLILKKTKLNHGKEECGASGS